MSRDLAAVWPVVVPPGSGASPAPEPQQKKEIVPVALVTDTTDSRQGSPRTVTRQPPPRQQHDDQHRGQLRFAQRLVAEHHHQLRYVHNVGWHCWDGARWARDPNGEAVRAAVGIVRDAYRDLPDLDRQSKQELLQDIHKCESANGMAGLLQLAGNLLPLAVSVDQLDGDPFLFNTKNGTFDLRTGELRRHDPADLLTKVAAAEYDPLARSETFDRFLEVIQPDPVVRAFLARLFGHTLLGTVREHVLPILTGTGSNGKSTLVETVQDTLGDYAISAEPDLLVERGTTHTTGQADLLGVRLAVCAETDKGRRLAAATVKRLTGGDKIRARRMRQDNIEFAASHSVVMVTNHKPAVAGDDPALWRRLRVVPFDVVVPNPNKRLKEQLAADLPAVLAWLIGGYRDWHRNGLDEPEVVVNATDAYRAGSDALGRFIDERCIASTMARVKARELFGAWSAWCHVNGEEAGTEKAFAEAMTLRGYEKKKSDGTMTYRGLFLAAEDDQ